MVALIQEIHSTEMTASCGKKVELSHEGKAIAWMTTALYRGCLADEALGILHSYGEWSKQTCEDAVNEAAKRVRAQAETENRPLSESVEKNETTIRVEVLKVVRAYAGRIGEPLDRQHRLIAVQPPIRWTFDHPDLDEPIEFASHLDLLYRDNRTNHLCIWDWKWRDAAPTSAYLARSMQFGPYYLAARHGSIYVNGEWIEFDEWPEIAWIHLPALKPYSRKTKTKDDDGELREFVSGEPRPLRSIIRWTWYEPEKEQYIRDEMSKRVRMFRAGIFPTNPDPVGCHICECAAHCPTWTDRLEADDAD